jgi:uncharacterized protein Yka (UPF0111/DUF47 family)
MTGREYSMAELFDKIEDVKVGLSSELRSRTEDLKSDIGRVERSVDSMKDRVVYTDLYQTQMRAHESEIELRFVAVLKEMASANDRAERAENLAKWALGVLVAILGFIIAIATGIFESGTTP